MYAYFDLLVGGVDGRGSCVSWLAGALGRSFGHRCSDSG